MSSSPLELLTEPLLWRILILLPVKHITRLRSISKFWSSLVLNPEFIKFHLEESPKNTHMLISYERYPFQPSTFYTLPCPINDLLHNPSCVIYSPTHNHHFTVLGVCNGLVCLLKSCIHGRSEELWVHLWNPATHILSNESPHLHIIHNSVPYFRKFGFGYDDSAKTYKVVVLDNDSQEMNVRIHTFGVAFWRNILTLSALPIMGIQGVSLGATVNWLAHHNIMSIGRQALSIEDILIFSYDLKEETYQYLSLPDDLTELPYRGPEIQALKGRLCLSHEGETGFGVWLMMQFGNHESWTRLLNVSYDHLYDLGPEEAVSIPDILCLSKNNDTILLANYENLGFVLYNRINNRMDRLGDLPEDLLFHSSFEYDESLVLPNRN